MNLDLYAASSCHAGYKISESADQSEILQHRWMKDIGERADFLYRLIEEINAFCKQSRIKRRDVVSQQPCETHFQNSKVLGCGVVKLPGNSGTFGPTLFESTL